MWPERGEALSRTIEFEDVLADLYAEGLNRYVVDVHPLVVPSLTAATLPPDPAAVEETTGTWDQLAASLILAGLSTLWVLALLETLEALGIPIPELPDVSARRPAPEVPREVLGAITRTSSTVTRGEVLRAVEVVENDDELRMARDDFVESQREVVARPPAMIRDRVEAAVRDATPEIDASPVAQVAPPTPDPVPDIEVVVVNQRQAAASVLTPGSEAVRDVARLSGYQAAGVQNAAVIRAAMLSEDELEKTWIATIDGKTRNTHFAADGQRAPLAGTFTVGGASLRFPGDPDGPPDEVANCRCRVGVLAPDEELPDEVDRHTERLNGRDSVQRNRVGSQADEINRRAADGVVRARDEVDQQGRVTAAGGWTAPSEQEYDMPGQRVVNTEQGGSTVVLADGSGESETFRTFTDQPIAFIGIETSDGRMLQDGIDLSFRDFPLPVMWCEQSSGGHYDSYTVGVCESAKVDGDTVRGSGYWLNTDKANDSFETAGKLVSRPSVDLAATEWMLTDENGKEITEEEWWDLPIDAKVIQCITKAELIGFTMVATPAFGDTRIEFNPERESRDAAIVASAADEFRPRVYPAGMFADPGLTEPTEIHMREDGRIVGHLACFGACHRSIQSACVMAPRSPSQYSQFLTSPSVALDNGSRQRVGRLTVGTGHAPDTASAAVAMAHYDNTGACFALVNVGEDSHGIWVSGVAAPWATAEQIEMGLAAPLSGDWRDFGQGLDLIAALAVNTPGFAVRGRDDAQGRPVALVASLGPAPTGERGKSGAALSASAIEDIVTRAVTAALAQRDTDAEVASLLAAVPAKAGPAPTPPSPEDEVAELLARI
ncbi:portal protein [Mycobacterium phage Imvubu]|uniref:Capsid maturation protease and MuF-like fusion protein n=1 Tax=Mycobacterium phage Imvubu TaxID=2686233 RepID=A0A6B9L7E1_9CAUD|nr:portal protein [Mycobacterium phage Imvubu]QHB37747.1 capsid maturation protease and MuF-like fusion protein [Mycobacterium phage Imvubu]